MCRFTRQKVICGSAVVVSATDIRGLFSNVWVLILLESGETKDLFLLERRFDVTVSVFERGDQAHRGSLSRNEYSL